MELRFRLVGIVQSLQITRTRTHVLSRETCYSSSNSTITLAVIFTVPYAF